MNSPLNIGYNYLPLNSESREIRVLWVRYQSLSDRSPLRCRLEHISLLQEPVQEYIAISYCWGDSSRRKLAFIDDQAVSIPESADAALRNSFTGKAGRNFEALKQAVQNKFKAFVCPRWIDAICINQCDLRERSEQVRIMGSVYSSAYCAIIWLGYGEESSAKRAKKVFEKASRHYNPRKGRSWYDAIRACQTLDGDDWKALDSVFSSPWFTRTWVRSKGWK